MSVPQEDEELDELLSSLAWQVADDVPTTDGKPVLDQYRADRVREAAQALLAWRKTYARKVANEVIGDTEVAWKRPKAATRNDLREEQRQAIEERLKND